MELLRILGLSVAAIALASTLVRVPLGLLHGREFLVLAVGAAPYLFIRNELLGRYTSAALAMGGAFGLLVLLRELLECRLDRAGCIGFGSRTCAISAVCYAVALVVGIVWLRRYPNELVRGA